MNIEEINDFYERQFQLLPDFKAGYDNLMQCRRKKIKVDDMDIWVQLNPKRSKSTEAKLDAVEQRSCFLCKANRPENQLSLPLIEGWDFLINPFPIFPVHFTIVNKEHEPQAEMALDMISAADMSPDMAFFFNGAKSGASAPDHNHFQGILKEELPLLKLIENLHTQKQSGYKHSVDFDFRFPMNFVSFVIYPDFDGLRLLSFIPQLYGYDKVASKPDIGMHNSLVWKDSSSLLRIIVFPRKAHRPKEFFLNDANRIVISPGAIDMAGMLITPDETTFNNICAEDIKSIFNQAGLCNEEYNDWKIKADKILSF